MTKSKHTLFFSVLLGMLLTLILNSSCKKKDPAPTPLETGTVTDVDNNTYRTAKIGNQWWMAENLRVTKYRNGYPVKLINSQGVDTSWANTTKGACCNYLGDNTNVKVYGLLYNWYALIDTGIIAPAGWHIPSDDEWKTLEKYLGMSQSEVDKVNWRGTDEADKLKVAPNPGVQWSISGNIWPTNESGFTALGGSCRLFNGIWGDPGLSSTGFWWSSTEHTANNFAWYRYLDYNKRNVFRYNGSKNYGMSIRCVKD